VSPEDGGALNAIAERAKPSPTDGSHIFSRRGEVTVQFDCSHAAGFVLTYLPPG
jgi:hypothetical protein